MIPYGIGANDIVLLIWLVQWRRWLYGAYTQGAVLN